MRALLIASMVCATSFAGEMPSLETDGPILEKRLGGMDSTDGVAISKTCHIFAKNAKIDMAEFHKLVAEVEKFPLNDQDFKRREVPSIEIWANVNRKFAISPVKTGIRVEKIVLRVAASSGQERSGKAYDRLAELVEKHCADLK